MDQTDNHPSRNELIQFFKSDQADPSWLGSHLDRCPTCQEVAEEVSSGEVPILENSKTISIQYGTDQPKLETLPSPSDRYRLLNEIARGGMAVVYRSLDVELMRHVAIKVINPKLATDSTAVARFQKEAKICARLQHPGIVPIHDRGQLADGRPFIAMKLIEGKTLAELLKARTDTSDNQIQFLNILHNICQAIAFAHQSGVIHRDLKPPNILVGEFGEVQVMDWGIAKDLNEFDARQNPASRTNEAKQLSQVQCSLSTSSGEILGTPTHLSPEQASGDTTVDQQTDVFSLGAILCEILTGEPVFKSESPATTLKMAQQGNTRGAIARLDQSNADRSLVRLTKRCISREKSLRPLNANELADQLAEYFDERVEQAKRNEIERVRAKALALTERKRRKLAFALAATIAVCCTVLTAMVVTRANERQQQLEAFAKRQHQSDKKVMLELGRAEQNWAQLKRTNCAELDRWNDLFDDATDAMKLIDDSTSDELCELVNRKSAEIKDSVRQARVDIKETQQVLRFSQAIDSARYEYRLRSDEPDQACKESIPLYRSAFFDVGIQPGSDIENACTKLREMVHRVDQSNRENILLAVHEWAWLEHLRKDRSDKSKPSWNLKLAQAFDQDSDRTKIWKWWSEGQIDPIKEFAKSDEAIRDAFTVRLLFTILESEKLSRAGIRLLKRAFHLRPLNFHLNWELGVQCARQSNNFLQTDSRLAEQAILHFQISEVVHGTHLPSRIRKCKLLGEVGRDSKAIKILNLTLKTHPDDSRVYQRLAEHHLALNQLDEAEEFVLKALELDPTLSIANRTYGRVLLKQQRIEEANQVWLDEYEQFPNDSRVAHGLAECARARGDFQSASDWFGQAIKNGMTRNFGFETLLELARNMAASGQTEDAVKLVGRYKRKFPKRHSEIHGLQLECHLISGNFENAISHSIARSMTQEEVAATYDRLATFYSSANDSEAASNALAESKRLRASQSEFATTFWQGADRLAEGSDSRDDDSVER